MGIAGSNINDGLWSWDLSCDRLEYSACWKSMVGYDEVEITNAPAEWLRRVHPADIDRLKENLAHCWQGTNSHFEMEYSLLHKNGQYRAMRCKCVATKDVRGKINHLIGSQTDITESKLKNLNYNPNQDRLTSLPNRHLFIAKLQELSQLQQHLDCHSGILYLDLDRFKYINHNFGQSVGDRLLVKIVHKLEACLQVTDLLARLGGDEFAILLTGYEPLNYPSEVASRIQQEFSKPIKVEEHSILITISIGIASSQFTVDEKSNKKPNKHSIDLLESLQNAEIAMHQAKEKGLASNRVFESETYRKILAKTKSEDELRKAIEQEQFELYYQPIVRLEDRQLMGFEALIRWQNPQRGLIPPVDFIPLAEDTGLIIPIGWWVLRSACLQMVRWQQEFKIESLFISVNITGKQFSQPYAGSIIEQILQETGFKPEVSQVGNYRKRNYRKHRFGSLYGRKTANFGCSAIIR